MYKNEMKKKILFFMPSFEGGGVEKNIIIIANDFASRNSNVSLITANKELKKKFNKRINFISPKNNFWSSKKRFFKYMICIFFLYLEFNKNNDFHVFCFQGNLICTIFCKIFGIKIIIRPNSSPSGWSKNIFKKIFFSKILKFADLIVVNSLFFQKEIKSKFKLNSRFIYNPLNKAEIFNLSKKKIRFNFFKKGHINLISVGRLVQQKDHMTILKAVNLLKDKIKLRLLIIGDGDQKKNLLEFIRKEKLNKFVKIKNRAENPYPYIDKAHIMLLSSQYEGLPNVLLEAISLKKFIISSDCPTGPKEILENGKNGFLFKIGDYKKLSQLILFYKNNRRICSKIIKNSYKRSDRFDLKINLDKYFNLFKKI